MNRNSGIMEKKEDGTNLPSDLRVVSLVRGKSNVLWENVTNV